ncbi:hypothetical protein OS493_027077 [Desmophyllum pertusum]|uniref:Uncharacterized protein n=1 Tax=Desmophyllum pertusum TaxID=174260 RepID=A0A9X0CFD4_9CNID|nr:hypothetical protein OS493_027077 [Desmophyllum pertusum]
MQKVARRFHLYKFQLASKIAWKIHSKSNRQLHNQSVERNLTPVLALYILEDEAANSETETSTNIPQGDNDDINCIATDVNQSKDAGALKPLVLPSFVSPRCCLEEVCLPRNARTETILLCSSVPCETVEPIREVVASKILFRKDKKKLLHRHQRKVYQKFTSTNHQASQTLVDIPDTLPIGCALQIRKRGNQFAYG